MFAVLHLSAVQALYIHLSTPILFPCVKGAGYKTSIVAVLYYGRLTVCMQLQLVENTIVFDDSGKQIDDMEESESKVEEDAKRKIRQHLFIG